LGERKGMAGTSSGEPKQLPRCISIVICNEVIEDKQTSNKTLVSLFNQIDATTLPSRHARMFVVASLTDGLGKCPITIRVASLKSDREIARVEGEAEFQDPLAVLDFVVELRSLPLFEEGVHAVDVIADGNLLSTRRFFVRLVGGHQQ